MISSTSLVISLCSLQSCPVLDLRLSCDDDLLSVGANEFFVRRDVSLCLNHQARTEDDDTFFVNEGALEVEENELTQQTYDPLENTSKKKAEKKPRAGAVRSTRSAAGRGCCRPIWPWLPSPAPLSGGVFRVHPLSAVPPRIRRPVPCYSII